MSKSAACIIAFSLGAAVGAVVSWKLLEEKYKKIADEEIASMEEYYSNRGLETVGKDLDEMHEVDGDKTYEILAQGYANPSTTRTDERKEDPNMVEPYVISPDEFDEHDNYEIVSYTFYADGILTNELDEPMEDDEIEQTVGHNSLCRFGDFEDDSVFVRNDHLQIDYEILRDTRNYTDVHDIIRSPRVGDSSARKDN